MELTDQLLSKLTALDKALAPKYNKFYIDLTRNGRANNFVYFRPKKEWLWVGVALERSDAWDKRFEDAGLEGIDYDPKRGKYSIRLTKGDLSRHEALLDDLFKQAYSEASGG